MEKSEKPPRLVKNPDKRGKDIIDLEFNNLVPEERKKIIESQERKHNLIKAEVTLRILVKSGILLEEDPVEEVIRKISRYIYDVSREGDILNKFLNKAGAEETPNDLDAIEREFYALMPERADKIAAENEFLDAMVIVLIELKNNHIISDETSLKEAMGIINQEILRSGDLKDR